VTSSRNVVRRGKQTPRVLLRPKFDNEDDAQDAIDLIASCRQELDPFQVTLVCITLASLGGRLAASEVGALIARQNGKGGWLEAVAIWSLFEPYLYGELDGRKNTTLWTAHELKTSDEAWARVKSLIEANSDLAAEVVTWNGGLTGTHIIELRDGSRLIFLARSKSSGRGFSPRRIIFDEAQELSALAFRAMMYATSAQGSRRQLIFAGTVPSAENDAAIWTGVRDRGRSGKVSRLAWAEWTPEGSDDPRTPPDPTDWKARAEANPALGARILAETIDEEWEAAQADLEGFMLERMSVWPGGSTGSFLFPRWADRAGETGPPTAFAVTCDLKRKGLYLGGSDGASLGVVTPKAFAESGAWVPMTALGLFVSEVARIAAGANVCLQEKGPAWHLREPLEAAGVKVLPVSFDEFVELGADLERRVETGDVTHPSSPDLDADVRKATWRKVNKRLVLSGDAPALEAAALALWGAAQKAESIYETRGLVTL
jgi:hypothetical protein